MSTNGERPRQVVTQGSDAVALYHVMYAREDFETTATPSPSSPDGSACSTSTSRGTATRPAASTTMPTRSSRSF